MSTREPLAIRAAIVAAIAGVLHVFVAVGLVPVDYEAPIVGAIDLVGTAVLVVWSRGAVTPVAAPKDDAGRPLTPEPDAFEAPEMPAGV